MTNEAEAMREAIAQYFERLPDFYLNVSRDRVASVVRALPLPEPAPTGGSEEDLRRLSADLVACGESEYGPDPRDALIGTDAAIAEEIADVHAQKESWFARATSRQQELNEANATIARLSAELTLTREALEPFAKAAEHFERDHPGWYHRKFNFVHGDIPFGMAELIDARAALAKLADGA